MKNAKTSVSKSALKQAASPAGSNRLGKVSASLVNAGEETVVIQGIASSAQSNIGMDTRTGAGQEHTEVSDGRSGVPAGASSVMVYDADGAYPLCLPYVHSRNPELSPDFAWLTLHSSEMEIWRALGHQWVSRLAHDAAVQFAALPESKRPRRIEVSVRLVLAGAIRSLRVFLIDYLQSPQHPERSVYRTNPDALLRADSGAQDDFWAECCLPLSRWRATKDGRQVQDSTRAASCSQDVAEFLDWVIRTTHPAQGLGGDEMLDPSYRCPFLPRTARGALIGSRPKKWDATLSWVERECPHLEAWRALAERWLAQVDANLPGRLRSVGKFIRSYLGEARLVSIDAASNPRTFLLKSSRLDDNLDLLFDRDTMIADRNMVVEFLDWVLVQEFSETDDHGYPVVSSAFRNPFAKFGKAKAAYDESVRDTLPYGYIDDLRLMLAQGPYFRDWIWAQGALSVGDWFPVSRETVDEADPDCVWRERDIGKYSGGVRRPDIVVEMWSPARWVALLTKLILPLRTLQVRVLDSGEADTYRYDESKALHASASAWVLNDINPDLIESVRLAQMVRQSGRGRASKASRQVRPAQVYEAGVFRRKIEHLHAPPGDSDVTAQRAEHVELYINTNKTADRAKEGAAKGYTIPWPAMPWPLQVDGQRPRFESPAEERRWLSDLSRNVHYWLQRLRDWQSKYNPVQQRTSWKELVAKNIVDIKTDSQLESYQDAVFLFRDPARRGQMGTGQNLPMTNSTLDRAWFTMLAKFEDQLAQLGHTAPDGSRIKLVKDRTGFISTAYFPLHSLRVSLVTALALDGGMPLHLLQKVVGHSRLIMTLYYTKPNAAHIMEEVDKAQARLSAGKEQSICKFLVNATIEQLRDEAAFNDADSAFAALGLSTLDRNPVGWMPMHNGICPVGGNTEPSPENGKVGGCFNGGEPVISYDKNVRHAPVPGGARNCVRCRWFITTPSYIHALVAQFNNVSYRYSEAQNVAISKLDALEASKDELYDAEASDPQLAHSLRAKVAVLQRQHEKCLKELGEIAETLGACDKLIKRCWAIARDEKRDGSGTALVANGGVREWTLIMESTDSELLQLSGVTEDAEVYTDLDPGKSVLRLSQHLDAALMKDGIRPRFFMLTEQQQLVLGNEFIRRLANEFSPGRPNLGRRLAIEALDETGRALSAVLGYRKEDVEAMIPSVGEVQRVFPLAPARTRIPVVIDGEQGEH